VEAYLDANDFWETFEGDYMIPPLLTKIKCKVVFNPINGELVWIEFNKRIVETLANPTGFFLLGWRMDLSELN